MSAAVTTWGSARLLTYRGETTNTDASIGYIGYRVYRGGPVFTRADRPPYTPSAYGPFLYLSLATVGRLAHAATYQSFLESGRALFFALYLLTAAIAFFWARRVGAGLTAALVGPLFVLSDRTFYPYAAGQRPDIAGTLFALLGFCLLSTGRGLSGQPSGKRTAGAGFLMGIAFLFKQTFLAAPLAAAYWLLWRRRWRLATVLAASALLPVALTVGWLELKAEPVFYSLLLLRHPVHDVSGEFLLIGLLVLSSPTVILQLVLGITGARALGRHDPETARLVDLYLALAAVVALLTMAQSGAARYYLIEPMTICSLLAPIGLSEWMAHLEAADFPQRWLAIALCISLPLLSTFEMKPAITAPLPDWSRLASGISGHRVLSDAAYIAAQGSDPELVETFVVSVLERSGEWSPEPVLRQIRAQQFDYAVLRSHRYADGQIAPLGDYRGTPYISPEVLAEIQRDYRLLGTCVEYRAEVFVPREEPRGSRLAALLAGVCPGN